MAKGTATSGRIKWRFCTPGLVRVGHPVVVYRRGQTIGQITAMGREFTVISPELLRPAGWDCLRLAWQAGIPGALRRSLGTAINLHDGLAIHRGKPEQSCGGPQPDPANFVRAGPRSRYRRKS